MLNVPAHMVRSFAAFVNGLVASLLPEQQGKDLLVTARDALVARAQARAHRRAERCRLRHERVARIEAVNATHEEPPPRQHVEAVLRGLPSLCLAILLAGGEYALNRWSLQTFAELDDERLLTVLALVMTIGSMIAVETWLEVVERRMTRLGGAVELTVTSVAVGMMGTAVILTARVRGATFGLLAGGVDLGAIERFLGDNGQLITLPMILLTGGVAIVGGQALHRGAVVSPVIGSFVWIRLALLRARIARLEGRMKADEKLAYACEKAVDKGYHVGCGLRVRVVDGLRALARPFGLRWVRRAVAAAAVAGVLVLLDACAAPARRPGTTIVPFDLTASSGADAVRQYAAAVATLITRLGPGERLIVIPIGERSWDDARTLIEARMPERCGPLRYRCLKAQRELEERWQMVTRSLAANAKASDVLGAIERAAMLCPSAAPCRLVVLSDLRHAVHGDLDFEALPIVPDALVSALAEHGRVASLPHAEVWLLGVQTRNKSAAYHDSLIHFWRHYFDVAGARVEVVRADARIE